MDKQAGLQYFIFRLFTDRLLCGFGRDQNKFEASNKSKTDTTGNDKYTTIKNINSLLDAITFY